VPAESTAAATVMVFVFAIFATLSRLWLKQLASVSPPPC
jgi:hypothetical protein